MAASFPTAVRTFTTRLDGETIMSAHVNALQEEVTAVETTLGTNPQGDHATVKARFTALENVESVGYSAVFRLMGA